MNVDYGVVRDSAYINASDPNTLRPKMDSRVFQQFRLHKHKVSRSMKKVDASNAYPTDYYNQSIYNFGAKLKDPSNIKRVLKNPATKSIFDVKFGQTFDHAYNDPP